MSPILSSLSVGRSISNYFLSEVDSPYRFYVASYQAGSAYVVTSDLINWTYSPLGSLNYNAIKGIARSKSGNIVLVRDGGSVSYSLNDGVSFSFATSFTNTLSSVAYSETAGLFITARSRSYANTNIITNTYWTSPTGQTWTQRTLPVSQSWNTVAVANNVFFMLPYPVSGGKTLYSINGTDWFDTNLPTDLTGIDAVYTNGTYLVIGSRSFISTTLTSWTEIYPYSNFRGITAANGKFYAISESPLKCYSSTNGIDWTAIGDLPDLPSQDYRTLRVVGNNILAVGATNAYSYSIDGGVTWTGPLQLPITDFSEGNTTILGIDMS